VYRAARVSFACVRCVGHCVLGGMYQQAPSIVCVRLVWGCEDTRVGCVLGRRHPLGSLRPFVVRFDLTYYDVWSAPAPLGFCAGGGCPFDGRT
jgi:hypothetical protein